MAEVTLPSLGESVTEGIITQWFKAVGDTVERDEPLYEVSTDKVDSEVPSPLAGVLTQILVPEGETVAVGAPLAVIGDAGDAPAPTAGAEPAAQSAGPAPAQGPAEEPAIDGPAARTPAVEPEHANQAPGGAIVSPLVRAVLTDAKIDASRVVGTGIGGHITRADAERAASAPVLVASSTSVPLHEPVATIATGFVAVEAVYDAVEKAQRSPVALTAQSEGVPLESFVFAVRAAVEALAEFPELNAAFDGSTLVQHAARNIGVAVDLDQGLVVPVVHDAQDLALRGLARRLVEVAERATARELAVEDLLDGTFTVVPSPSPAVHFSVPVVIEPQVAVMSIDTPKRKPVVIATDDGSESLAIRTIGILGLSFDTRVIDASTAASFLARVVELLASQDWVAQL